MRKNGTLALVLAALTCSSVALSFPARRQTSEEPYPYGSPRFTRMVAESYRRVGSGQADNFYIWMERAYRRSPVRLTDQPKSSLTGSLAQVRQHLNRVREPDRRAEAEAALGARLHRLVKTMIPRFSLDRGFEFTNVARYGERQCFLQAVLIAGLLQRMGVDAGVVMVYRSVHGQESNNGHAVTLLRLANGQDVIVDASEREPFARQQGLFVWCGGYQYVEPVFKSGSGRILRYRLTSGKGLVENSRVQTLDLPFLHSQFWYYRGERQAGGILSRVKTPKGLAATEADLRKSVTLCPQNPLSVYMLGRVALARGRQSEADHLFSRAVSLYTRFGYVPTGPKQYYALASRRRCTSPGG